MSILALGIAITVAATGRPAEETAAEFRERAAQDVHRPRYHFVPSAFWINDPNGLIQYKGVYHLFYQLSTRPEGPDLVKHWGHATSTDLVRWEELPVALSPSPGGPDSVGCWSGSAIVDGDRVRVFYTGVMPEVQCLATAQDDALAQWEKFPGNPVIGAHASGLPLISFRDPTLWRDGDTWMMGVGTGVQGKGGAVLAYRSDDLRAWRYAGPLFLDEANEYSYLFECPSFLPIGDKHLLLYSGHLRNGRIASCYFLGQYEDARFTPGAYGPLDLSSDYYAAQAFKDESGRILVFAWDKSGRDQDTWPRYGWSGAISFPRELSLGPDGGLCIRPARELAALRGAHSRYAPQTVTPASANVCDGFASDECEIAATFTPGPSGRFGAERFGLVVRRSPGGEEQTRIYYEPGAGRLVMDRERASLDEKVLKGTQQGSLALSEGEALTLRIYLDRSVIEVYANDRVAGTLRVYPTRGDSLGVGVFTEGGDVSLAHIDAWELQAPSS